MNIKKTVITLMLALSAPAFPLLANDKPDIEKIAAVDTNHDKVIDAKEIAAATPEMQAILTKFDKSEDGSIDLGKLIVWYNEKHADKREHGPDKVPVSDKARD